MDHDQSDPRFSRYTVLLLAAKRVWRRHRTAWERTEGLAALLEAARSLPKRDPWDLPDLDTTSGLGKMLAEARAWQKEERWHLIRELADVVLLALAAQDEPNSARLRPRGRR